MVRYPVDMWLCLCVCVCVCVCVSSRGKLDGMRKVLGSQRTIPETFPLFPLIKQRGRNKKPGTASVLSVSCCRLLFVFFVFFFWEEEGGNLTRLQNSYEVLDDVSPDVSVEVQNGSFLFPSKSAETL